MNKQINEAVNRLAISGQTWVENKPFELETNCYAYFWLSREQFLVFQDIVSSSVCCLGKDIESSVKFFEEREKLLNKNPINRDGTPNCSCGWYIWNIGNKSNITFWYEIYEGSVLLYSYGEHPTDGETFRVFIREDAQGESSSDLKDIKMIQAGMTLEQYNRWKYLFDDEDYEEWATFHNKHIVPHGWKPMKTGNQIILEGEIFDCIEPLGDLSLNLGIGAVIDLILGPDGEIDPVTQDPRPMLSGEAFLIQSESILSKLKEATHRYEKFQQRYRKFHFG